MKAAKSNAKVLPCSNDGEMRALIDTHAHLYPFFRAPRWAEVALRNLLCAARDAGIENEEWAAGLCVLSTGGIRLNSVLEEQRPVLQRAGWHPEEVPDGCIRLTGPRQEQLWLFPGRQISTYDGLEVLELLAESDLPENHAVDYLINTIPEKGAVPVLPWSPGKWLFHRGRIVRNLIDTYAPGKFLLGVTSMLPAFSLLPALLRMGRSAGYTLVAGSDPLPLHGEESYLGSWVTLLDSGFDPTSPVESLRKALLGDRRHIRFAGRRPSWPTVVGRWWRWRCLSRRTGRRPVISEHPS